LTKVCILLTVQRWNDMRLFYRQAQALAVAGYEVDYVCLDPDIKRRLPTGLRFIRLDRTAVRRARLTGSLNLMRTVMQLRPDVLHITCVEQLPLGLVLSSLGCTKVVYDCREDHVAAFLGHKESIPRCLRPGIALAVRLLEIAGDYLFDGLIASDPAIYDLHSASPDDRKIVYLNVPQLSMFHENYLPLKQRPHDVALMGALVTRSGLDTLLEAIGHLKQHGRDCRLLLIGTIGEPGSRLTYDEIVHQYDLGESVNITGWVDHLQIPGLLAQAKIGVSPHKDLPKFRNNIACKVFEYMAVGMPVICSDLPPQRLFVQEGVNGLFFRPGDPIQLAEKIDWLLTHIQEAESIGRQGRISVEQRWNCEAENKKLIEFYNQISSRV